MKRKYLGLAFFIFVMLVANLTKSSMVSANATNLNSSHSTSPSCGLGWNRVDSPNPSNVSNDLEAVVAFANNDVWASGHSRELTHTFPLMLRWDGSTWNVSPVAEVITATAYSFYGLTGKASTDIWAVGDIDYNIPLAEHWDGSSWSVVDVPNPGTYSGLSAAINFGHENVWAVGHSHIQIGSASRTQPLIEHWDGFSWQVIPSPIITDSGLLNAISGTGPNDIWAVGYTYSPFQSLIEHWDGSSWQIADGLTSAAEPLNAVSALSTTDAWAVGDSGLIKHWDGITWSVVSGPSTYSYHAIAAVSANDIWALGYEISHWDGNTWSLVVAYQSPDYYRAGAAAIASNDVWSVGGYNIVNDDDQTLTERYSDPCITPTPPPTITPVPPTNTPTLTNTPLPTNTPGGPTDTPLPTNTPAGPTPTTCPLPFVDLNGNVFFAAIKYLYCRGVVSGIDATHYGPAGTSTRAQFAKVVVLGFGIADYSPATPTFSDVAQSYFAYAYIESGFHAGILSGFDAATCQAIGTQPPCYGPNRPITRAQLTKLVVAAGGFAPFTPTSPTFSDVGTNNVFYASIETAHHHGVINGYPDGTFRPGSPIRRDEMAQIVYKGVSTP